MILFDIVVAVAPVSGYYSQLKLIEKENSVGSFSIYVTAILMISGILRIYFWFASGYAINLLFQAIFIIIIQAMLLKECVRLTPKHAEESFWKWNTLDQYIRFLLGMTAVVTVLTVLSKAINIPYYGDALGFASLSIEATLGFPQMISNFQTKSVKGLSFFMIFTWFAGDFMKTLYFILEKQPFQFVMCGVVQLTVDIIIVLQIINYRKPDFKTYDTIQETEA